MTGNSPEFNRSRQRKFVSYFHMCITVPGFLVAVITNYCVVPSSAVVCKLFDAKNVSSLVHDSDEQKHEH